MYLHIVFRPSERLLRIVMPNIVQSDRPKLATRNTGQLLANFKEIRILDRWKLTRFDRTCAVYSTGGRNSVVYVLWWMCSKQPLMKDPPPPLSAGFVAMLVVQRVEQAPRDSEDACWRGFESRGGSTRPAPSVVWGQFQSLKELDFTS